MDVVVSATMESLPALKLASRCSLEANVRRQGRREQYTGLGLSDRNQRYVRVRVCARVLARLANILSLSLCARPSACGCRYRPLFDVNKLDASGSFTRSRCHARI
jgi:hypothetical protein